MNWFKVKYLDETGRLHSRNVRAKDESEAICKVGAFVRVLACSWIGRA